MGKYPHNNALDRANLLGKIIFKANEANALPLIRLFAA
jgi:hypothetical protein